LSSGLARKTPMSIRMITCAALIAAASFTTAHAREPHPHGDPRLAAEASIAEDRAQAIALEARPGEVREWELEREHGALRYSFDIASGGVIYEVGVDAQTGAVLENAPDGEASDRAS